MEEPLPEPEVPEIPLLQNTGYAQNIPGLEVNLPLMSVPQSVIVEEVIHAGTSDLGVNYESGGLEGGFDKIGETQETQLQHKQLEEDNQKPVEGEEGNVQKSVVEGEAEETLPNDGNTATPRRTPKITGGRAMFMCSECPATYSTRSHLTRHMDVHKGIRFTCPQCDKSFTRNDKLQVHLRTVHSKEVIQEEELTVDCLCVFCWRTVSVPERDAKRRLDKLKKHRVIPKISDFGTISVCDLCKVKSYGVVNLKSEVLDVERKVARLKRELVEQLEVLEGKLTHMCEETRMLGCETAEMAQVETFIVDHPDSGSIINELLTTREEIDRFGNDVDKQMARINKEISLLGGGGGAGVKKEFKRELKRERPGPRSKKIKKEKEVAVTPGPNNPVCDVVIKEEVDDQNPGVGENSRVDDFETLEPIEDEDDSKSEGEGYQTHDEDYTPKRESSGRSPAKKRKRSSSIKPRTKKPASPLKFLDLSGISPSKKSLLHRFLKFKTRPHPIHASVPDPRSSYSFSYHAPTSSLKLADFEIRIDEETQTVNCPVCPYNHSFANPKFDTRLIFDHILGKHLSAFDCLKCEAKLTTFSRYCDHMRAHENEFLCHTCGKSLSSEQTLRAHSWTHKTPEAINEALIAGEKDPRRKAEKDMNLPCDLCGKLFPSRDCLRQHKKTHDPNRERVQCPTCGKSFLPSGYESHRRNTCFLPGLEPERSQCPSCPATFKNSATLKNHIQYAHSEKGLERGFRCDICGKGYPSKNSLTRHVHTHSTERPYTCTHGCGSNYKTRKDQARHEKKCSNKAVGVMHAE